MNLFIRLILGALSVMIAGYFLPGVHIRDFFVAVVVSLVIGFLNTFVKPVLKILTLPINVLTLGLFTFVINGILILFVSNLVPGFTVDGLWTAILYGIVLSVIGWVIDRFE